MIAHLGNSVLELQAAGAAFTCDRGRHTNWPRIFFSSGTGNPWVDGHRLQVVEIGSDPERIHLATDNDEVDGTTRKSHRQLHPVLDPVAEFCRVIKTFVVLKVLGHQGVDQVCETPAHVLYLQSDLPARFCRGHPQRTDIPAPEKVDYALLFLESFAHMERHPGAVFIVFSAAYVVIVDRRPNTGGKSGTLPGLAPRSCCSWTSLLY